MWKSPIDIFRTEIEMHVEADVIRAVSKYNVNVDKDELFKLLRGDRESYERGYDDGYDAGFNASKWVPCSERLPEPPEIGEDSYIVQKATVRTPFSAYWDGEHWTDTDDDIQENIIAWMSLPQPYKGE